MNHFTMLYSHFVSLWASFFLHQARTTQAFFVVGWLSSSSLPNNDSPLTKLHISSLVDDASVDVGVDVSIPHSKIRQQMIRVVDKRKESVSKESRPRAQKNIELISLSPNPLLFLSSTPLLTPQECQTLSDWCRQAQLLGKSMAELLSRPEDEYHKEEQEAVHLMKKLQRMIHHSILGMDEKCTDYVVPRYLHYQSNKAEQKEEVQYTPPEKVTVDQLVPDGLHVDTNNNMHFRHWTILAYLDSTPSLSSGGATTFPLAEREDGFKSIAKRNMGKHCNDLRENIMNQEQSFLASRAAFELILKENIQHTRISDDKQHLELGKCIEQAALHLFQEDTSPGSFQGSSNQGIRVVPQQGHVCLFSGLQHDGYPNPLSFHAGEAILVPGHSKNVLTFFYEIPTDTFSNRAEFGEQVRKREEEFLKFHGSYLASNDYR